MEWTTLRKGPASLHITYGLTFTNNLSGYNTRVRVIEPRRSGEPSVELVIDLTPNLRTRNKAANDYADASELANGDIAELKFLQILDDRIIRLLDRLGSDIDGLRPWRLTIELAASHTFMVMPKRTADGISLFLFRLWEMPRSDDQ